MGVKVLLSVWARKGGLHAFGVFIDIVATGGVEHHRHVAPRPARSVLWAYNLPIWFLW